MTNLQYFRRTFRYMKPYKFAYAIGTFFYCVQSFAFPLISSVFFGGVTTAIMASHFAGVLDSIWLMVGMLLGFAILVGSGAYIYIVKISYAVRDMSIDLFRAFTKSSIESQKHSGESLAAINTDINTASDIFSNAFTPFLQNVIAVSFSVVAVFVLDWRMGIGALVVGLGAFFVQSRFATPLARLGKEQLDANADSVKSLSNIFAGALTIRAYNRQDRSLIQFDLENGKLKKLAFKQAFIGMWQDLFTTVQGWLTLVVTFALGGWLVVLGEIDFAVIMMVLPLAEAISGAMSQIGTTFAGLQPPIVAAKRVFDIIDSVPQASKELLGMSKEQQALQSAHASNAPKADELQSAITSSWGGAYDISLSKLSFSYKDAGENALIDIDLSIGENEMIAFVGESGSGKSTLLRLLIGMYERDGLDMEIGGMPFASVNINEWRSYFAYVDQSCKLFDMSIAENIAMGCQGKKGNERIQEAAKRAFAHDFISELSEGYATSCGEKGASLSGGQKQRIAIARALYRKAPVLVFDEATSSLDKESERFIMDTINSLRSDHTILMTTHNLENVVSADKIVVMDKGRIKSVGTHQELLSEANGLYHRLYSNARRKD